jgi:hypothetical protein
MHEVFYREHDIGLIVCVTLNRKQLFVVPSSFLKQRHTAPDLKLMLNNEGIIKAVWDNKGH